jgi:hypothetical protein
MGETRTETKTDKEIADDVSRHPNEREAARARLIDKAHADKKAKPEEQKE